MLRGRRAGRAAIRGELLASGACGAAPPRRSAGRRGRSGRGSPAPGRAEVAGTRWVEQRWRSSLRLRFGGRMAPGVGAAVGTGDSFASRGAGGLVMAADDAHDERVPGTD